MNKKQITKLGAILYKKLNVSDWEEVFRLCDQENYLKTHLRFLRSLKWDNQDAKSNCFKATEYLYKSNSEEFYEYLRDQANILNVIKIDIPDILPEIIDEDEIPNIDIEEIASLNEIIREAIDDAEDLIEKGKPSNAYDRVYTALHGVLKTKCEEENITIGNNGTVTSILSKIRTFVINSNSDKSTETGKIIASITKIVDILNELRNKSSLAHPNEKLIANEEALFFINIAKAMMRYVNAVMR